jgi:hypothetical protein
MELSEEEKRGGDPPCWEHLLDEDGMLREPGVAPLRGRTPPAPEQEPAPGPEAPESAG